MNSIINRLDYDIKFAIFINNVFKVSPPEKTLDVMISDSIICTDLENNRDNFFYLSDKEIFLKTIEEQFIDINDEYSDIALWISKTYLDLFFKYKKSFQYIISYLPVSEMTYLYKAYHQANESMIEKEFLKRERTTPLLKILLKRKELTLNQLSALTKINYNTLDKYIRNSKYLHVASYDNIYRLSIALGVRENIFSSVIIIKETYQNTNLENYESIIDHIILSTIIYNDVFVAKINFSYTSSKHIFESENIKLIIKKIDNIISLKDVITHCDIPSNKGNLLAIFIKDLNEFKCINIKHLSKIYVLSSTSFYTYIKEKNKIIQKKKYSGLSSPLIC